MEWGVEDRVVLKGVYLSVLVGAQTVQMVALSFESRMDFDVVFFLNER